MSETKQRAARMRWSKRNKRYTGPEEAKRDALEYIKRGNKTAG